MGIPMLKEFVARKYVSVAVAMTAAVMLGACSSSVTRLDFPTFGLGSSDKADAAPVTVHSTARINSNDDNNIIRGGASLAEFDPGDIGEQNGNARNSYMPPQVRQTEVRGEQYHVQRRTLSPVGGGEARAYETSANNYERAPMRPVQQPKRSFLPSEPHGYDYNRKSAIQRTASVNPNRDIRTSPVVSTGQQTASGEIVVRPGDTLYSIGRRYDVTIVKLMEINQLSDSNIVVGQRLRLPDTTISTPKPTVAALTRKKPVAKISSGTYTVKPGDTFHSIAQKVSVDSAQLADVNGITDTGSLRVGEVLILPTTNKTARATSTVQRPKVAFSAGDSGFMVRSVKTKTIKVASLEDGEVPSNPAATASAEAKKEATVNKHPGKQKISAFRWPVQGRIIEKFGARDDGTNNDGINLAVPKGTQVKAAEDGVVAYAGSELKGYGNLILIRHADGWVSAYAHNEKILVKRGDTIKRGQVIARAGMTGSVDQPQLHFELRRGSKPVDPLKFMSGA